MLVWSDYDNDGGQRFVCSRRMDAFNFNLKITMGVLKKRKIKRLLVMKDVDGGYSIEKRRF